jgi:hypothetical protein
LFELTVRNPVARLTAAPSVDGMAASTRSPRLDRLDGARLGLWWNQKVGGDVALEWLAASIASDSATTSTPFYGRYPASKEMIAAATGGSDAVVGATAD